MQRGGSRSDKERIKIQQTRAPGQLLQSGEGDRGEASANVRQARGHLKRPRGEYQQRHASNEATVRRCEQPVGESGNENGHNEQGPG